MTNPLAAPRAIDPDRWADLAWLDIAEDDRPCWCLAPLEMSWHEADQWARQRWVSNLKIIFLVSGETLVRSA
jgi:hypothetical protein